MELKEFPQHVKSHHQTALPRLPTENGNTITNIWSEEPHTVVLSAPIKVTVTSQGTCRGDGMLCLAYNSPRRIKWSSWIRHLQLPDEAKR